MTSESDDQKNRPIMFARLSSPTKPAAAPIEIVSGNISWIIGDAWPSTPMPAVTFMQSTIHSSQNCGVVMARSTVTFPVVTRARGGGGVHPSGRQPWRGTRTVNTPNIMKQK